MVDFVFRRRVRQRPRLSAVEVERRLGLLVRDPLYAERRDKECLNFVTRQFDRIFGTGPGTVLSRREVSYFGATPKRLVL